MTVRHLRGQRPGPGSQPRCRAIRWSASPSGGDVPHWSTQPRPIPPEQLGSRLASRRMRWCVSNATPPSPGSSRERVRPDEACVPRLHRGAARPPGPRHRQSPARSRARLGRWAPATVRPRNGHVTEHRVLRRGRLRGQGGGARTGLEPSHHRDAEVDPAVGGGPEIAIPDGHRVPEAGGAAVLRRDGRYGSSAPGRARDVYYSSAPGAAIGLCLDHCASPCIPSWMNTPLGVSHDGIGSTSHWCTLPVWGRTPPRSSLTRTPHREQRHSRSGHSARGDGRSGPETGGLGDDGPS